MFGFSQAFYFMEKDVEADDNKYEHYGLTWVALFHMTLSEYDYDVFEESSYSVMAKLFFFFFQVIMPILLLNMLIAMMGNTYAIVSQKSEKEFLKQVRFQLKTYFLPVDKLPGQQIIKKCVRI